MEIKNFNNKITAGIVLVLLTLSLMVGMNQFVFADNPSQNEQTVDSTGYTTHIFAQITGDSTGRIQGGATQSGHEGQIEIMSFSHGVVTPRDAATGLPTGKRQHKPVSVTKSIDKASPLLMNTQITSETLTEVIFSFYQTNSAGETVNYYTITLTNAHIVSFRTVVFEDDDTGRQNTYEQISFTYQKITWTFEDGGIMAEDDWETPVA